MSEIKRIYQLGGVDLTAARLALLESFAKRTHAFLGQKSASSAESRRDERLAVQFTIDELNAHESLRRAAPTQDLDLLVQALRSTLAAEEADMYAEMGRSGSDPLGVAHWNLLRDRGMADNLQWLLETRYAGHKVIVWAATAHLIRNALSIENLQDPKTYYGLPYSQAGEHLYRRMGRDVYTIAFTSGSGKRGDVLAFTDKVEEYVRDVAQPRPGSLEDLALKRGDKFLFLDLRSLPESAPAAGVFESRLLGNLDNRAKWRDVVDGVFFIRENFPERYEPWPKEAR